MEAPNSFFVKNCTLSIHATGDRAESVEKLRDKISHINLECLYYHFWGRRLNPQLSDSDYRNDFSSWIFQRLHNISLAERLSVVDPRDYHPEELRKVLLTIIDDDISTNINNFKTSNENKFSFVYSKIFVFETQFIINHPKELPQVIQHLSPSMIFYHFIDARRRTEGGGDDFSTWLKNYSNEFSDLIEKINRIDFYFISLIEIKNQLIKTTTEYFNNNSL